MIHVLIVSCLVIASGVKASDFDVPEWKTYGALVGANKAYARNDFATAIEKYEQAKRSYKQCHNHDNTVLGAINFGLYLSHNQNSQHDKAHQHLALAAPNNPTAAWLYADELPVGEEKNRLLAYAYNNKQSPAAIMLGDLCYEKGDLNAACDYYAHADQMLSAEKNLSLVDWCENLLECRIGQMLYDTGSNQEALNLWKQTYSKTTFDDIKQTVIDRLVIPSAAGDSQALKVWSEIADFSQKPTRAMCISFLRNLRKEKSEFSENLVPILNKLLAYVESYDDTTKDLLLNCYQSLNPDARKANSDNIERILQAVTKIDGHWFAQKLAFFIERAQTDLCHLEKCSALLKKGIKKNELVTAKDKHIIGNLLKQMAEKKEFGPYIDQLKKNNIWTKYRDYLTDDTPEQELIELHAQKIYHDQYDKNDFDTTITPLLLKILRGTDVKAQSQAVDLIAWLSYRMIFFDQQDHEKILKLLASLKNKLPDKKDKIEFLLYSLNDLLSLRKHTDQPHEQIALVQNMLPVAHIKSIESKDTPNELRHAKHLADLYALMSVLCKQHNVQNRIQFIQDYCLLNAETCMHGAVTAYNLLSKQTADPDIAQAAALRIAEIALLDVDVFTEYGPDNDPFNFIRQILEKFVHDNPQSINVRFLLAKLYADGILQEVNGQKVCVGKDLDKAINELEILRQLNYGHFKLAECYLEKKEFDQARAVCLEGYEHTKNDLLLIYGAEACLRVGNTQAARDVLSKLKGKTLEDHIKNQQDMIKLFILCKEGVVIAHQLAQAIDKIPLSIIHQKSIKHAYQYLTQNDMNVLIKFGDELVKTSDLTQKEVQILTKIGAILLHASDIEPAYYQNSICYLEEAVENLSTDAAHLLAQDNRYSADKGRCNTLIGTIGTSALHINNGEKTHQHRLVLEEFKAHLLAQAYLITYNLLVAQTQTKNIHLLSAGCSIATESAKTISYDDEPDDYYLALLEQETDLEGCTLSLTQIIEKIFKQEREALLKLKTEKDKGTRELKKLGMYGIQCCLMRCYLAAAKKALQDADVEKVEEYLDNAFYYLTDLALTTSEIVAPANNAKRVLSNLKLIAELARGIQLCDFKYYQDLVEILKKAKLLLHKEWLSFGYDAGSRVLVAAEKNKNQILKNKDQLVKNNQLLETDRLKLENENHKLKNESHMLQLCAADVLFYAAQHHDPKAKTLCLNLLKSIQMTLDKEKKNEIEPDKVDLIPIAELLKNGSKYKSKEALSVAISYFSERAIKAHQVSPEQWQTALYDLTLIYEYASDDAITMIQHDTQQYTALCLACDAYITKLKELLTSLNSKSADSCNQEEVEKTLHILGLGCEKQYKPAVETLLKYYSRMFNMEKNSKRKNKERIAFYKNALERVCYMASKINLESVKCVQNSKDQTVYEVLYDMGTDSLMSPDDPSVKDFVVRMV